MSIIKVQTTSELLETFRSGAYQSDEDLTQLRDSLVVHTNQDKDGSVSQQLMLSGAYSYIYRIELILHARGLV